MKRMFLLAMLVMACVASYAQNKVPDEFFGMKFGTVYSLDEMKDHVGSAGTFVQEVDNTIEFGNVNYPKGYAFKNVKYNDRWYPSMAFLILEHGTFGGVGFTFTKDNIPEDRSLENIYEGLKRSLEDEYGKFGVAEDSLDLFRLTNFHNSVGLKLDKRLANNEITRIDVAYISMSAALKDVYSATFPTIQDAFFGMKMGSRQTTYSVRSAVGRRGEYLEEKLTSYGKKVIFKKIIFAGDTWDFGEFSLTNDGELFDVNVYDSLNDGYSCDDERKDAERTYTSYKNKLDEKYGSPKENDDDSGKYVCYVGNNAMAVILSNKRGKSSGGEYRRFVGIDYFQTEINGKVSSQSDDEL